MATSDAYFLNTLEHLLLQLKAQYGVTDLQELKQSIMHQARQDSENLSLQEQMELLAVLEEVWEAFSFAEKKHKTQSRESGEPYIMHPLLVAINEIYHQKHEKKVYAPSPIIAALLHDTLEDTDTTYEELSLHFGKRVEKLVENLSNKPEWETWKQEGKLNHTEKAALQFINAVQDPASMDVKFDDRTHNLDTIRFMSPQKQVKKILDTLSVGFIDKAEKYARYDFLIQLYISIQRYLTDENIELFAEDPKASLEMKKEALSTIKTLLEKHHTEIFTI